jgi:ABC-2 type transport system ATP-binding protein
VHYPEVVFLDEPTTGLDPQGRLELWDIIRELAAGGKTILLTTQYLEEADRLANRIAVIDRGTVIAEGTPAQLKAQFGSAMLEVDMPDEAAATRAESLLASYGVERDGKQICIKDVDGPRVFIDALCTLEGEGLTPQTMAVRQPSLDDVFLALTGRRAESDGNGEKKEPASGGPG